MQSVIALAVISGATVVSIGIALALECLLLKVILGMVANATAAEVVRAERRPEPSFSELRRQATGARLVSHLG